MTVSHLKNKLLEVVRRVEKGEVFEITKDGAPVAILSPHGGWNRGTTGFGRVEVKGTLNRPAEKWTFDLHNIRGTGKRKP